MSSLLKLAKDLLEIVDKEELRAIGRPAMRHKTTGKVVLGKRGEGHTDIDVPLSDYPYYDTGIYNPRTKQFHDVRDVGIGSADLMSRGQRFRKYGTEY